MALPGLPLSKPGTTAVHRPSKAAMAAAAKPGRWNAWVSPTLTSGAVVARTPSARARASGAMDSTVTTRWPAKHARSSSSTRSGVAAGPTRTTSRTPATVCAASARTTGRIVS